MASSGYLSAQGDAGVSVQAGHTHVQMSSTETLTVLSGNGNVVMIGVDNTVQGDSGVDLGSAGTTTISAVDDVIPSAADLVVGTAPFGTAVAAATGGVSVSSTEFSASVVSAAAMVTAHAGHVDVHAAGPARLVATRVRGHGDNTQIVCNRNDVATTSDGLAITSGNCSGASLSAADSVAIIAPRGPVGFVSSASGAVRGSSGVSVAARRNAVVTAVKGHGREIFSRPSSS